MDLLGVSISKELYTYVHQCDSCTQTDVQAYNPSLPTRAAQQLDSPSAKAGAEVGWEGSVPIRVPGRCIDLMVFTDVPLASNRPC